MSEEQQLPADSTEPAPVAAPTAPEASTDVPAPPISLTSLLGGAIEGGMSCEADGTCD